MHSIPKVHIHNTKDATHRRYSTPKKYCNQDIIHQCGTAPTIQPTKDANAYQKCIYIAPKDAVHQKITSPKMHSTRDASNKRYYLPKLQNHNFGKLWPKMPHNPFSWGINECFFYHHVLIPTRHIFVCCIIDSLWAVPRTQNFAFFEGISQRFYSHQAWTPKRHLFIVATLCR